MIKLLKEQIFRAVKKPWFILIFLITFTITVWIAVSPLRDTYSYQGFMNRYGSMSPQTVSRMVLDEARPDMSISDIYDEFMIRQKDFLFPTAYVATATGLAFMGCIIAAFFLGRELTKRRTRAVLIPGQSRGLVFTLLAVRYYLAAFILIVASLGMVRTQWSIDLSMFPRDYVVSTQLRFLLYCFAVFSGMMLVTVLVRNPVGSALASLAFVGLAVLAGYLAPTVFPTASLLSYKWWEPTVGAEYITPHVITSAIAIVVFTAASYIIYRNREI